MHHVLGLAVLAGDDGGFDARDVEAEEAGDVDRARDVVALAQAVGAADMRLPVMDLTGFLNSPVVVKT